MSEGGVTSKVVCKMFDLAPTTLVSWADRGFLPKIGGKWKRYGRPELMQVAALVELGKIGKLTKEVAEAAEEIAASASGTRRIIGHPAPETLNVILVLWDRDENKVVAFTSNWASVPWFVRSSNKGAAAIVFDTEKLRLEVEQKLCAVLKEEEVL
jgi:hypothetical protein